VRPCFDATPLHAAARLGFESCVNSLLRVNTQGFQTRQGIWRAFLDLIEQRQAIVERKEAFDHEVRDFALEVSVVVCSASLVTLQLRLGPARNR